jgi:succinate-semialdehyde dehydrogenase/glutarate-semialdehyde dehydrogenase
MTSATAGAVRDVPGGTGLLGRVPTGIYVGGAWLSAPDRATFTVEDPAGGGPLAAVADGGPREALAALDSAVAAAPDWAARAPRARSEILARTFELLLERRTQFATLITLESGKPLAEADAEVAYAAEFVRWYAEEAVRVDGRYASSPAGTGRMVVSQRPVGPCYLVTPWNFPLAMATRKLAPALAAGCPVVLKPAELTPLSTLLLATLIEDAGVPPGVVNIVPTARPAAVSEALLADPRLRKVSFTGSTRVGKRLLELAARNVLRTSMELGGNAPFLIFADADLDAALDGAMQAKFRNAGQACTAANRFLVHATLVDAFAERIGERVAGLAVGPGSRPGTAIGPLIDARAVARIDALVGDALERGAQLLTGGHPIAGDGHFFEPTVLAGVRPGSKVLREEIFGPVVAISAFDDEDEAVQLANDTEYGLASYVYTRDLARAQRMIDTLESGMTAINVGILSDAAAPFGGMKASGLGREGGYEGIREYLATTYALTKDPRR